MASPALSRRTALASAAAAAVVPRLAFGKTNKRPNFLFILADDMGYADLSCYGREDYRTPALDGLAEQGLRLTHAYANSAVCTASRVALITGRYQYRLPIGLEEPLAGRPVGLPPSEPTLPSRLRGAGYATALIGKWHLGQLPRFGPLQSGYDHFWGFRTGAVDYFDHASSNGADDLWDQDVPVAAAGYMTDLLGRRAVGQLEWFARQERPFLLSLHFSAPHWPWEGPDDAAEGTRLRQGKKFLASFDAGDMATYARMVERLDLQVGAVLQAVDRLALANNTVVVFASDNGGERFSKTWPFSGRKTELLEGGLRIPTLVRWPGVTRAGFVNDAAMIHMDWAPTFCAAAGIVPETGLPFDGTDIRALLAGGAAPARTLFWRYKAGPQRAARADRWKYLKMGDNEFLFDVLADPMERANLKQREPRRFAALKQEWESWETTMLPIDGQSFTHGLHSAEMSDRFNSDD